MDIEYGYLVGTLDGLCVYQTTQHRVCSIVHEELNCARLPFHIYISDSASVFFEEDINSTPQRQKEKNPDCTFIRERCSYIHQKIENIE